MLWNWKNIASWNFPKSNMLAYPLTTKMCYVCFFVNVQKGKICKIDIKATAKRVFSADGTKKYASGHDIAERCQQGLQVFRAEFTGKGGVAAQYTLGQRRLPCLQAQYTFLYTAFHQ